MTERYFRCRNDACRKKWHRFSLETIRTGGGMPTPAIAADLFRSFERAKAHIEGCPACGGAVAPEDGTFEELFQARGVAA